MPQRFHKSIPPLCCILSLALAAVFVLYGPFETPRIILINTAMYSSHFKFLAASLYSREYIAEILNKNFGPIRKNTNADKVNITGSGSNTDGIIWAEVKGNYYKGIIIKVDDPRRITFVSSENQNGEILETLVNRHHAAGGINASGYVNDKSRGIPWGYTVENGIKVSDESEAAFHILGGFNKDYVLQVGVYSTEDIKNLSFLWAVEFGPILIIDGEKTEISEFAGGYAPRTAIGQTADGAVLLVVIDGRQVNSIGATYKDIQTILYSNGAVNAIGLDGGSSSTIMFGGKVLNNPSEDENERRLPNAILISRLETEKSMTKARIFI